MTNTLQFETIEGGPLNTAEFGSTSNSQGYAGFRAMDSYSHVASRTAYPPTLITIGVDDHRVPTCMGAGMAARLQAATSSGQPVLLRVDFEGGHHTMAVAKDDEARQFADTFAFALRAASDPQFQPTKPLVGLTIRGPTSAISGPRLASAERTLESRVGPPSHAFTSCPVLLGEARGRPGGG